nr:hypothetical protein [Methylibium sp. T29-B]
MSARASAFGGVVVSPIFTPVVVPNPMVGTSPLTGITARSV